MNVNIQRLNRAHKSLPTVFGRRISTEEPPRSLNHNPGRQSRSSLGLPVSDRLKRSPIILLGTSNKIANSVKGESGSPVAQPVSPVHWSLGQGYEVAGLLKRGEDALKGHDEKRLPIWGKWGIPIKFLSGEISALPNFWLRDNCRCAKCVNQDTMQRAFDTFSIPSDIIPSEVVTEKEGLRVTWSNDNHISLYPWDWIIKHRVERSINDLKNKDSVENVDVYWGSEIEANPPSVHYDEIMADDPGVGKWTSKIREYGFCYVGGCPISPEKTQELLERIAFIRITHYGGFYDFTSDLTMKDTAYTSLALGSHTDTTYFTDPAGLQMFHLLSHTSGNGGASLLVDGFHAARTLRNEAIDAYHILAKTPIMWHASGNEGITITPGKKFPVLNFGDYQQGEAPSLMQVRWNNDDRGVVGLRERNGMGAEKWYAAAKLWDSILKRKNIQYWAQLEPGRPLIFDNWRVMHGRSAFTGKRRICGGYVNHDDFVSRWRNTNFPREEVLKQIL